MLACYERPEDIARPIAGAADAIFFEVPTVCRVILRIHRTLTSRLICHMEITVNACVGMNKRNARMTELAHTMPRNFAFVQPLEQRRTKLQDAVSEIPPAKLEQEIADALKMNMERRLELKSKIDELSTEELERLLTYSAPRVGAVKIAEPQS